MKNEDFKLNCQLMFDGYLKTTTSGERKVLEMLIWDHKKILTLVASRYKQLPSSLCFFISFLFGFNKETKQFLEFCEKRVIKLTGTNQTWGTDLVYDLNDYLILQAVYTRLTNKRFKLVDWYHFELNGFKIYMAKVRKAKNLLHSNDGTNKNKHRDDQRVCSSLLEELEKTPRKFDFNLILNQLKKTN